MTPDLRHTEWTPANSDKPKKPINFQFFVLLEIRIIMGPHGHLSQKLFRNFFCYK